MFFTFYRGKNMEKTCWHVFFWMFFHVFPSSSGTWWTSPWGHRDRRALHGCHSWGSNSMVHQQPPESQTLFPTYRNSQKVGKETSCSRNSLTRTRITRGVHVVWKKRCETSTSSVIHVSRPVIQDDLYWSSIREDLGDSETVNWWRSIEKSTAN